jgi:hypothetical protein
MDVWFLRWLRRSRGRGRDISVIGSLCLLINNVCGPSFVEIPTTFATSGALYATALFVVIAVWSAVVSLQLAETAGRMPGNRSFSHRFELSKLSQVLTPRWAAWTISTLLALALTALNVGQIVVLAQTMDSALLTAFGKTCAIVLQPTSPYSPQRFVCISADDDALATNSPFGDTRVLSLGYAITALLVAPFSLGNLDDNVVLQVRRERRGGGRTVGARSRVHTEGRYFVRRDCVACFLSHPLHAQLQVGGMVVFVACVGIIVAQLAAMGLSPASTPVVAPASAAGAASGSYISAFETVRKEKGSGERHAIDA